MQKFLENTREPGCLRSLRKLLQVAYLCKVTLNLSLCHEDVGTGWRWVVSLSLRPLCPNGKSSRYELDRKWTPEPIWMWCWREIFLPLKGIEPWSSNPSLTTSLLRPSWLPLEDCSSVVVTIPISLNKVLAQMCTSWRPIHTTCDIDRE
jgi:hypothetical protein